MRVENEKRLMEKFARSIMSDVCSIQADTVLRGILHTVLQPDHTKLSASRSRLLHLLSHKFAAATARWKFGSYPRLVGQTNPTAHVKRPLVRGCISVRLNYFVAHLLQEHEHLEVAQCCADVCAMFCCPKASVQCVSSCTTLP